MRCAPVVRGAEEVRGRWVKEWYGWHFPEMARILNDNMMYAKSVKKMGMRNLAESTDFSDILPSEIEDAMKDASKARPQ